MQLERFHYKHLFLSAVFFLFLLSSAFVLGTWLITDSAQKQLAPLEQALEQQAQNTTPDTGPNPHTASQPSSIPSTSPNTGVIAYGWSQQQPAFPWCYQSFAIDPKALEPIAQNSTLTSTPIEQVSSDLFAIVIPAAQSAQIPMSQTLGKKLSDGSIHIGPLLPQSQALQYQKTMDSSIGSLTRLVPQNRTQTISQISYALYDQDSYQIVSNWLLTMPQIITTTIPCTAMMTFTPPSASAKPAQ